MQIQSKYLQKFTAGTRFYRVPFLNRTTREDSCGKDGDFKFSLTDLSLLSVRGILLDFEIQTKLLLII